MYTYKKVATIASKIDVTFKNHIMCSIKKLISASTNLAIIRSCTSF